MQSGKIKSNISNLKNSILKVRTWSTRRRVGLIPLQSSARQWQPGDIGWNAVFKGNIHKDWYPKSSQKYKSERNRMHYMLHIWLVFKIPLNVLIDISERPGLEAMFSIMGILERRCGTAPSSQPSGQLCWQRGVARVILSDLTRLLQERVITTSFYWLLPSSCGGEEEPELRQPTNRNWPLIWQGKSWVIVAFSRTLN